MKINKILITIGSIISFFQLSHSKNYTLTIGINNYSGQWNSLDNTINDCKDFEDVIRTKTN